MYLSTKWTCPYCHDDYYSISKDKIEHLRECGQEQAMAHATELDVKEENKEGIVETTSVGSGNPLKRSYFCDKCNTELSLTPVEILKHKRTHS